MRFPHWIFVVIVAVAAPSFAQDDERERDEDILRKAGVKLAGTDLIDYFQQRNVSDEQRKAIVSLIRQFGHESFRMREKASDEVEKQGLRAISLLKQHVNHQDAEIARRCRLSLDKLEKVPSELVSAAAARMLGRLKPPRALEVLLAHLTLAEDEYVAEALRWGLTQLALRDGTPEPALVKALGDPSGVRRAAAAEALIRAGAKSEFDRIRTLLKDNDAETRFRTAHALVVYAREKQAIPELIAVLSNGPMDFGWQAEEVLHRIAGEGAPTVALSNDRTTRLQARDAWLEWWNKNNASVNLAKLDERPKYYGYLMVLQISPNGGGKVVEYAPDGKTVRWQIDGLQFPISAQVLPSQHVLIAEHNSQQITERDGQGRIHWRKQVAQPVYCERLANGNTFIVSRGSITETTKDGTEVFTFTRPNQDIVAGSRARDGQVVFATQSGQVIRIDNKGRQVRTFQTGRMYYYSHLQVLPNNRIVVTLMNSVAEYDEITGKQIWSATVSRPSCVQRLPNGNTLASSFMTRKVVELDRNGKAVSEHTPPDGSTPYRAFKR